MESEIVSVVLGGLSPFLVSLMKAVRWPKRYKVLLCVGVSLVIGFIGALAEQNVTLAEWLKATAIALGTAQSVYAMLLERTGLEEKLRKSGIR
jgi:peptidoglycan/LPS O-acetylase OafA/YrhL